MMIAFILLQALLLGFAAAQNSTAAGISTATGNSTTTGNSTAGEPNLSYPLTTDGQCGPSNGRMCLMNGTSPCCSSGGYCGTGQSYCSRDICQSDYGKCESNDVTLNQPECSWAFGEGTSPRCDGRCGSAYNNAICAQHVASNAFAQFGVYDYGPCCSTGGFCGNTSDHCSPDKGCQSESGTCYNTTGSSAQNSTATGSAAAATSSGLGVHTTVLSSGGILAFGFSAIGLILGL